MELMLAIREITGGDEVDITHIETLLDTFDKDGNGEIDFSEFQTLQRYLRVDTKKGRKSRELSVRYVMPSCSRSFQRSIQ
jgi:hypothetical protein